MAWTKSDHEGKICWEQGGQRLFDTADIDKLQGISQQAIDEFAYIGKINIPDAISKVLYFIIGICFGFIIGAFY